MLGGLKVGAASSGDKRYVCLCICAQYVVYPDVEEQTAIATILSDMDAEIQALEKRLSKTRQINKGMMQELLTGKTRFIRD